MLGGNLRKKLEAGHSQMALSLLPQHIIKDDSIQLLHNHSNLSGFGNKTMPRATSSFLNGDDLNLNLLQLNKKSSLKLPSITGRNTQVKAPDHLISGSSLINYNLKMPT